MEWITSLLNTLCPFCGEQLGSPQRACADCARRLSALEASRALDVSLNCGHSELSVRAAFDYGDFTQKLILRQKENPSFTVVRWMARMIFMKIPAPWRQTPLVWLPAKPLAGIHLVEALALELSALGQPLARGQYLKRRLRPNPPQKSLDLAERSTRDMNDVYRVSRIMSLRRGDGEVILLDDVVTTGSTLRGCRQILKERLGIEVRGALALAFTKRKTD